MRRKVITPEMVAEAKIRLAELEAQPLPPKGKLRNEREGQLKMARAHAHGMTYPQWKEFRKGQKQTWKPGAPGGGSPKSLGLLDHPGRCQAYTRDKSHRCERWAVKGSKFCLKHGGSRKTKSLTDNTVRLGHLPRFYSKRLGKTLKAVVEEAMQEPLQHHMNVVEELTLIRESAGNIVAMYSATCDLEARAIEKNDVAQITAMGEAKVKIGRAMAAELKDVIKTVQVAAQVEAMAKDKVSVHSLALLVNQMVRLMYDCCGTENQHIAEMFEQRVSKEIRMPAPDGAEGTLLTPDMDAIDMDATVPRLPSAADLASLNGQSVEYEVIDEDTDLEDLDTDEEDDDDGE